MDPVDCVIMELQCIYMESDLAQLSSICWYIEMLR